MGKTTVAKTALILLIIVIPTALVFFDREEFAPKMEIYNLLNPPTENASTKHVKNTEDGEIVDHNPSLPMPDEYDGSIEVSPKKEMGQGGPIEVQSGESGPEYPDADNIIQVEYQYTSSETLNAPEGESLPEAEPYNNLLSNSDYNAELPEDEEPLAPSYVSSDNSYPEPAPEMEAEGK